jgi:hypothetical protein
VRAKKQCQRQDRIFVVQERQHYDHQDDATQSRNGTYEYPQQGADDKDYIGDRIAKMRKATAQRMQIIHL